jgi:hypothetical protein
MRSPSQILPFYRLACHQATFATHCAFSDLNSVQFNITQCTCGIDLFRWLTDYGLGSDLSCSLDFVCEGIWSSMMSTQFRVELVWVDKEPASNSSLYLTSDGGVVLQGAMISEVERQRLELPSDGTFIRVDRNLITAIKNML